MAGFFRMYRSFVNNPIWKHDPTAWHIFEYFLGKCDYRTGTWTIDYLTMSEYLGIPKATLHKAIKRLKKAKMVNDLVNEHNTTFSIVNWSKYQGDGERDGELKVNEKGTESEHIKGSQEVNILLSIEQQEKVLEKLISKGMPEAMAKLELSKFISYWTEKNFKGKQRWQMEKTFEPEKRLARWFSNISKFSGGKNEQRGVRL